MMEPMSEIPSLSWQGSLFDTERGPAGHGHAGSGNALLFDRLVRHRLDDRTWVDEVTGWQPGHGELFDLLLARAPWRQRERRMYDRMVLEPRMVAHWSGDALAELPPELEAMRVALSNRYRVDFDSVGINLYRDGRDGVAWHGDSNRKTMHNPLVATVSLGERRRFLMRPGTAGSPTHRFRPGGGDLLVMGGACQHSWQHHVPKETRGAGARMSVTLRHSREGWWTATGNGR
jgi:alkylated DNA repair dioxygenase AlkB